MSIKAKLFMQFIVLPDETTSNLLKKSSTEKFVLPKQQLYS